MLKCNLLILTLLVVMCLYEVNSKPVESILRNKSKHLCFYVALALFLNKIIVPFSYRFSSKFKDIQIFTPVR